MMYLEMRQPAESRYVQALVNKSNGVFESDADIGGAQWENSIVDFQMNFEPRPLVRKLFSKPGNQIIKISRDSLFSFIQDAGCLGRCAQENKIKIPDLIARWDEEPALDEHAQELLEMFYADIACGALLSFSQKKIQTRARSLRRLMLAMMYKGEQSYLQDALLN